MDVIASHSEARKKYNTRQDKSYLLRLQSFAFSQAFSFSSLEFFYIIEKFRNSMLSSSLTDGCILPKLIQRNWDFTMIMVTEKRWICSWLFFPQRNTVHIVVGKLSEDDLASLCRKYRAAGGGGKALRSKLTTKKAFNNQRQKLGFRWKYSNHSEVILSLQLSSISEGQLIRI